MRRGQPSPDATLAYDDETVANAVDDYGKASFQLHLLRVVIPLAGLVLGLLLLGLGVLALTRGRETRPRYDNGHQFTSP